MNFSVESNSSKSFELIEPGADFKNGQFKLAVNQTNLYQFGDILYLVVLSKDVPNIAAQTITDPLCYIF